MDKQFVHLHLHTDHSLLDGAIKIEPLARRAAELKMPAVAITDHGNLYGALSFYHKMRDAGVKPIIGIEAYIARNSRHDRGSEKLEPGDRATNHIVLLAKNLTGYHNLVKLSSFAYMEGFWRKPRIDRELLAKHSEGIIGLSACISGVPPHLLLRDKFDEAARASLEFQDILGRGNYYLEIQEHGLDAQNRIRKPLLELSKKTGIPMVATNDSHYLMDTDVKAHDTLLCIGTGKTINDPNRLTYGSPKYYFRSAEEMWETFGEEPDLLLKTLEIAEKCDLTFPKSIDQVPVYPVPDGHTVDSYFEKATRDGFEERFREIWQTLESSGSLRHPMSRYRDRLTHEIETIKRMGFSGYFLIVWDFIRYAKDKGIPVGPGRGCLAGNTPIVMADGATKPISQVKLGDRVRSHSGQARPVRALHRYDVDETLVRLKCYYGDSIGVTLTGDHKVLAERGVRPENWERMSASTQRARRVWEQPVGKLDWIPANQLNPGDWVWVPTPAVEIAPLETIDLAATSDPAWAQITAAYIEESRPVNRSFDYSMRDIDIHRHTGVSRNSLKFIMQRAVPLKPNPRHDRAVATVSAYVEPRFISLDEWRCWVSNQSHVTTRITRFIQPDSRFFRILGRWIADGWLRSDDDRSFGLCFNSDDKAGIAETVAFFESLGLQPYVKVANDRKLTQITVRSRTLVAYWRSLFPLYRSTPETKSIPEFVLRLPVENVLDVLAGYWNGDGCAGDSRQSKYATATVSRVLADQVRFLGWRCGIPSSLRSDDGHDDRFQTQPNYYIVMAKDERLAERLGAFPKAAQHCWRAIEGGILLRIREVEEVKGVKEVFDITVEEDHTYQTSSFAVHNSAAGSLAAYCLKITDVDPIQYDLLFERFLNPERVTMPDIDVDFCVRGRADVISYVSELYGRQNVAQIITFGTMASRAVIKDVGRALEMPYSEVEKVAKMIPPPVRGRNVSITDAISQNPDLKKAIDTDGKVSELIEIARKLEGCNRHTSVHAAGVVISPLPIHELIPVCKGQNDELTTQFVMSDLEKTGMLKMDFLALTTLTIIEDCLKSIEREIGHRPNLAKIPLDDKPALKLFADGLLNAIFQFESCLSGETQIDGMGRTIRELYEEFKALKSATNSEGRSDVDIENRRFRIKSCYVDEGKFHSNHILDVVATGVKPIYRLITKGNFTIKATADHYFLTERGWIRLGDLDVERDKVLFKTDAYYAQRVCLDCRSPLKTLYRLSVRCKSCASRLTSNPGKPRARERIRGKNGEEIHGTEKAAELRARASAKFSGAGNPMYGRSRHGAMAYSASGFRDDLGHYVRSSWEADFARVLNYCGMRYEYNPRRFTLVRTDGSTLTYAPDFFVPDLNVWYEIKGWMDLKSEEKIRLFSEQYPEERLVVIDKTRFAESQMQYSELVEWECPKTPPNTDFLPIESITCEGEEETYDIKMLPPGNNFLANGFIVHNSGMVEICRRLKPESLEDLSALNALYRPGPLDGGMVDDFIERRHGRRKVQYIIPQMREILENTLGILIYQEQIMQLAQNLAGYSLGEADLMRRAMGKKKKEEMAKHEEKFISGAVSRGIQEDKARKIFTLMAQFADYGFNRSHSFAYAYLAYQTAWLKAHYPTHFYAAVLSNEIANSAKLARYIAEMKVFEIEILPPDVNSSHEGFTPVGKAIRFGLAAIKGLGSSAVQMIIRAREEGGAFRSIYDFAERVDQRAVNKRVLESLIKSGAFDGVAANRAAMMAVLDKAIEYGARAQRDKLSGQTGLFGDIVAAAVEEPALPSIPQWSRKESLALEKEALGFYASGHPLEDYAESIKGLTRYDSGNIEEAAHGDQVALGGIIVELTTKITKKGDRFALFRLEDQYGSVKVVCWPEQFNKYKNLLQSDEVVLVRGKLELSDEGAAGAGATIVVQELHQLERARSSAARAIVVRMPERSVTAKSLASLADLISGHQGSATVLIQVETDDGMTVQLRPQQFFRVNVSPELTAEIEKIADNWQVQLVFGA